MKVKELIEILSKLDNQEQEVKIGYDNGGEVELSNIYEEVNQYGGDYILFK